MKKCVSDKKAEVQLSGVVIPTDWHANGTPSAWSLSAVDEEIYQIDMGNPLGRQLKNLLQKKIQIIGRIVKTTQNQKKIAVRSFVVLDEKPK